MVQPVYGARNWSGAESEAAAAQMMAESEAVAAQMIGVLPRVVLLEHAADLRDGRPLLADRDVDAVERLGGVALVVHLLLHEDGVDGDGGLAGLAIADDQLALPAADRDEAVHGLEAGLHRLVHALARENARRLHLDTGALEVVDRALAVDRVAEGVDHAAEEPGADADVHNGARALHHVAFEDLTIVTEDHNTHVVVLKVEGHAAKTAAELNHLAGLHLIEAVHAGDPVTHRKHLPDLIDLAEGVGARDAVREDRGELAGGDRELARAGLGERRGRFRLLGRERWEEREEREERRGRRRAGKREKRE